MTGEIQKHLQLILDFIDQGYTAGIDKALGETDTFKRKCAETNAQLETTDERLRATGMTASTLAADVRAGAVGFDDFKRRAGDLADEVESAGPKMLGLRDRGAQLIENFERGKISATEFRAGIAALDAASLGSLKERAGALALEMRTGGVTLDDFKSRARELGNQAEASSPKMQQLREKSAGLVEDLAAGRVSPQRFREEIDKLDVSTVRHKVNVDKLRSSVRDLGRDLLVGTAAATGFTMGLYKLVEMGGQVDQAKQAWQATINTLALAPDTLEKIRVSIRGALSDMAIMQTSTETLATGIDPTRIVELWAKAHQISEVTGRDIKEVIMSLALAIETGNTMMLKHMGIVVEADRVYRAYAESIRKPVENLNDLDRQYAISMEIERQYQAHFASLGDVSGGVSEKLNQVKAGAGNLKNELLAMIANAPAIQKFLGDLVTKTDEWLGRLDKAGPAVDKITGDITRVYQSLVAFGEDKAGPAIANIYKYRDAFAALAVTIGTGLFASKLMGIMVAMGAVTGPVAAQIALIAGATAGLGTAMALEAKESDKGASDLNATLRIQHDLLKQIGHLNFYGLDMPPWNEIKARIADLEAVNAEIEKLGKQKSTAEIGVEIKFPANLMAPAPTVTPTIAISPVFIKPQIVQGDFSRAVAAEDNLTEAIARQKAALEDVSSLDTYGLASAPWAQIPGRMKDVAALGVQVDAIGEKRVISEIGVEITPPRTGIADIVKGLTPGVIDIETKIVEPRHSITELVKAFPATTYDIETEIKKPSLGIIDFVKQFPKTGYAIETELAPPPKGGIEEIIKGLGPISPITIPIKFATLGLKVSLFAIASLTDALHLTKNAVQDLEDIFASGTDEDATKGIEDKTVAINAQADALANLNAKIPILSEELAQMDIISRGMAWEPESVKVKRLTEAFSTQATVAGTLSEKLTELSISQWKFPPKAPGVPPGQKPSDVWAATPPPRVPELKVNPKELILQPITAPYGPSPTENTAEAKLVEDKLKIQVGYQTAVDKMRADSMSYEDMLRQEAVEKDVAAWETRKQYMEIGFSAMSKYAEKFYAKNTNMGRTLNAMLIAGFGEVVSSYLMNKAKEAAFDALFYGAQAIASAAVGNWGGAAAFAEAAAEMGALAGIGAAAAAYVSYESNQRAANLTEEKSSTEETQAEAETTATRKKASGIVQTRPIYINIYATSNFNAGNMIFGDGEAAAHQLYENCIRKEIESDIGSGMIAIPS